MTSNIPKPPPCPSKNPPSRQHPQRPSKSPILLLFSAVLILSLTSVSSFVPNPRQPLRSSSPVHNTNVPFSSFPTALRSNSNDDLDERTEEARLNLWKARRGSVRSTLKFAESIQNYRISQGLVPNPTSGESDSKVALSITAFTVAAGAIILRVGGRAALVSTLGLDFITGENSATKSQMDSILGYAAGLSTPVELGLFVLGWILVKTLCFDAGGVVLAISSGVLFGGVWQGAVVSAASATVGSLVAFGLSKTDSPVRTKALEVLEEYPQLRGIEKVVAKDGVKAILTLRLAPVLPIPIGMYNYIYGITNVPVTDFVAGIFLGSLKPYLLDSYLGVFAKDLIDGTTTNSMQDYVLLGVLGVSVLIGVFASQLAGETWEAIQAEVEVERKENDGKEVPEEDQVTESIMGIDLPQFIIGLQLSVKDAERRVNSLVDVEYQSKVWNYTLPTDNTNMVEPQDILPTHLDPARFRDSPEVVGANKGISFAESFCDGLVLSPVLLFAFFKYADPLLDSGSVDDVQRGDDDGIGSLSVSNDVVDVIASDDVTNEVLAGKEEDKNEYVAVLDTDTFLLESLNMVRANFTTQIEELDNRLKN